MSGTAPKENPRLYVGTKRKGLDKKWWTSAKVAGRYRWVPLPEVAPMPADPDTDYPSEAPVINHVERGNDGQTWVAKTGWKGAPEWFLKYPKSPNEVLPNHPPLNPTMHLEEVCIGRDAQRWVALGSSSVASWVHICDSPVPIQVSRSLSDRSLIGTALMLKLHPVLLVRGQDGQEVREIEDAPDAVLEHYVKHNHKHEYHRKILKAALDGFRISNVDHMDDNVTVRIVVTQKLCEKWKATYGWSSESILKIVYSTFGYGQDGYQADTFDWPVQQPKLWRHMGDTSYILSYDVIQISKCK